MWPRWEGKARRWFEAYLSQLDNKALALAYTMLDMKERTGINPNHKFWWDVLIHLEIDPHEVVESYDKITMRYGEHHEMFKEFADWCHRRK